MIDLDDVRNHTELGTGYTKDAMLNLCADEITSLRAELKVNNHKVILALASIRDIFEYDDEMVMSGALSYPEDVAGFVKTKVAELKAREKALVEALIEAIGYISPYTVNDSVVNRWKAIANVRGDVK